MDQTTARVRLTLTGHGIDPEDITTKVGLQPASSWRSGELVVRKHRELERSGQPILRPGKRFDHDGWVYISDEEVCTDLGDKIERFLIEISPNFSRILSAKNELSLDVELKCSVFIFENLPFLYLKNEVITRICLIGANFDVDVYGCIK